MRDTASPNITGELSRIIRKLRHYISQHRDGRSGAVAHSHSCREYYRMEAAEYVTRVAGRSAEYADRVLAECEAGSSQSE